MKDSKGSQARIFEIDGLRALAILIVVAGHAGLSIVAAGTGVTIFFVISGYVITASLVKEYKQSNKFSIKKFYLRRIYKIIPPLISIIIIPSVLLFDKLDLNLGKMLSQTFFLWNWSQIFVGDKGIIPGSGVVWSLSVEEQFYIIIALTWAIVSRVIRFNPIKILFYIYLFLFVVSTFTRVYLSYGTQYVRNSFGDIPRLYYGTDARIGAIAVGGLVAIILCGEFGEHFHKKWAQPFSDKKTIYVVFLMSILSVSIHNWHFLDTLKFSLQEVAFGFLIAHLVLQKNSSPFYISRILRLKIFQMIGRSSYSIYLVHSALFHLCNSLIPKTGLVSLSYFLLGAMKIILAIILGKVCHELFDAPFEAYRQKYRVVNI